MSKITIAIAQTQDKGSLEKNLESTEAFIKKASLQQANILAFPEMWLGNSSKKLVDTLQVEQEQVLSHLCSLAKEHKIALTGSMVYLDENGLCRNSSPFISEKGKIALWYHKTHLFTYFHEEKRFQAGDKRCSLELDWGKVGFSICYDIRFPGLFRAYALEGVELIFCPASFPHPRSLHWSTLTRARAIENQVFMVCPNKVGKTRVEGMGEVLECGQSSLIDPNGRKLLSFGEEEELLSTRIDLQEVHKAREKITMLQDHRESLYKRELI